MKNDVNLQRENRETAVDQKTWHFERWKADRGSFTFPENQTLQLSVPRGRGWEATKSPTPHPEPWRGSGVPPAPWKARSGWQEGLWGAARMSPPPGPPWPLAAKQLPHGGGGVGFWSSFVSWGNWGGWGWGAGPKVGLSENLQMLPGQGVALHWHGRLPSKNPQRSPRLCPRPWRFELLGLLCFSKQCALLLFNSGRTWCSCLFVQALADFPFPSLLFPHPLESFLVLLVLN